MPYSCTGTERAFPLTRIRDLYMYRCLYLHFFQKNELWPFVKILSKLMSSTFSDHIQTVLGNIIIRARKERGNFVLYMYQINIINVFQQKGITSKGRLDEGSTLSFPDFGYL